MFENLYKGFGHTSSSSLLIINKQNQVIAFRGAIPLLYQIPLSGNKYDIIKAIGMSGWIMKKDASLPKGLGLKLHYKLKQSVPLVVAACFGNDISLQVYKMDKFNIINNLNRYVLPLNKEDYKKIINPSYNQASLDQWMNKINKNLKNIIPAKEKNFSPKDLEKLWIKISHQIKLFGVYKNLEYWNWRYLNCPYNKYIFFGDLENLGVVIVRIENIFKFKNKSNQEIATEDNIHNKKILRVIEILPYRKKLTNFYDNDDFYIFFLSILKWAQEKNCVAADFQFSSLLYNNLLKKSGFLMQTPSYEPSECSLAGLFQPFKLIVDPINVAWSFTSEKKYNIKNINTYFTKTDVAGDYSKFWPKII